MKKLIATIAGLAMAGAALAQVDTTLPMLTGRGNADGRPGKAIVTHQTAPAPAGQTTPAPADQATQLEKFVVTGSLIPMPANEARSGSPPSRDPRISAIHGLLRSLTLSRE
jgi:hypothetical protein